MNEILLETSTIRKLKTNVSIFFDTPRDKSSRQVVVSNLTYVPYVEDSQLMVKANTKSKNTVYSTVILLDDVKFVDEQARFAKTIGNNAFAVTIKSGNDKYYILPVKQTTSSVLVSCTCLDFYYMFSVWNQKDMSLHGDPPEPYIKKTDRPVRNPQRVSGACKHILRLSDTLIGDGILK